MAKLPKRGRPAGERRTKRKRIYVQGAKRRTKQGIGFQPSPRRPPPGQEKHRDEGLLAIPSLAWWLRAVAGVIGDLLLGPSPDTGAALGASPPRAPLELAPVVRHYLRVLELPDSKLPSSELVAARRRELALRYHPDRQGGDLATMVRINQAAEALLGEIKGRPCRS